MNIFDALTFIGGLCLFLFGMNIMGQSLERRAGNELRTLIGKMTDNRVAGLLTGIGVTSVIQSSSATTVMVVGFVNSGLMSLKQAINVIMGANIGTTVTAWLLSLGGIDSDAFFLKFLKPSSFTPVLALIGIILYMASKQGKRRDTGMILLGFATLMFGMETMSSAVSGLADVPAFQNLFLVFRNPIFGVLAGAVLTAVIQSSSASVGILQALTVTGSVTYSAALPIIMGQNIGTCITAIISSIGANKNAKRAAAVHLCFNIIGTVILLSIFCVVQAVFQFPIFNRTANYVGIAVMHSVFNILCTAILFPMTSLLERFVIYLIPDAEAKEYDTMLDERLFATPSVALERCRTVADEMAICAATTLKDGILSLHEYSPELAQAVRDGETETDAYEDRLGTYLVKLSGQAISTEDSAEAAEILRTISDFERISDHGVNLLESAEELRDKKLYLSNSAQKELSVLTDAVCEIVKLASEAFLNKDLTTAFEVEPLEQVIDSLKEQLRTNHIMRLQHGDCTIELGFVWSDLLTNLERVADHCSNIAGCVIDMADNNLNLHQSLHTMRADDPQYQEKYRFYEDKYALPRQISNCH